jgi:NAD(P)-dependent dehydrogenase (short-subunit alcohol dehydrogenase family)
MSDIIFLITGASGGIGKFLSHHYAQLGYEVFGTYNSNKPENYDGIELKKVDVSNHIEVESWISSLPLKSKKIILINSAGISYNAFGHKADPEKWREVINVNLFGSFNTSRYVLPLMRDVNFGRIINFSSVVAQVGIHGTSAYSSSKAALWGLTKTLAIENASKGITVNTLTLGYFNIGMISTVPDEMQKIIAGKIPMQGFGNPDNIIKALNFLIESDYTTGESININGGLY